MYQNQYCNIYNQIASDIWKTDNSVHKLTMNNPQLVFFNELIRAIFEHKGSQGSVATHLRCSGIVSEKLRARLECPVSFLTHGVVDPCQKQ